MVNNCRSCFMGNAFRPSRLKCVYGYVKILFLTVEKEYKPCNHCKYVVCRVFSLQKNVAISHFFVVVHIFFIFLCEII